MTLYGGSEKRITKDKIGENFFRLETFEIVLVHCSLVNNVYQHDLKVFNVFTPSKLIRNLVNIFALNILNFLKHSNSSFLLLMYGLLIKTLRHND